MFLLHRVNHNMEQKIGRFCDSVVWVMESCVGPGNRASLYVPVFWLILSDPDPAHVRTEFILTVNLLITDE